jgi:fido (protein-threonine AMPylation protein)
MDPDSGVLRNRFGITDEAELQRIETAFAAFRAYGLHASPVPARYDLDYLRQVHRTLFGDVYPRAGELRTVDIIKGNTR